MWYLGWVAKAWEALFHSYFSIAGWAPDLSPCTHALSRWLNPSWRHPYLWRHHWQNMTDSMVIVYVYPHDWLIYMVCNCNCKCMPWPWMLWSGMPPSSSKNYYQDHYCIYFSSGFRESCILPTGILGGRSIPSHFFTACGRDFLWIMAWPLV